MTICTFAGHRTILAPDVDQKIDAALKELIKTDDQFIFLSGGMGILISNANQLSTGSKSKTPKQLFLSN